MTIPAQDVWQIHEDGLYQLISIAMQPGGVLGVQANPDGSTGIQLLDRVVPPERNVFPQIGLMCSTSDETVPAAHTRELVTKFDIVIAVKLAGTDTEPDTGRAALQLLRNYQNDGSGNGLSPLLRANVTLFGLADRSSITHMERVLLKSESGAAESIAMAIYTFETYYRVRTQ